MANILRMDFYRLVHSKVLWICLAILVAVAVVGTVSVSYMLSPEFADAMRAASAGAADVGLRVGVSTGGQMESLEMAQSLAEAEMMIAGSSQMAFIGSTMISGGALATLFVIFIAIFFAAEFETGYSKNVFTARSNRTMVFVARLIEIALLALIFTVVGIGSTLISLAACGLDLVVAPVLDMLLWGGLIALLLVAYGMITLFIVWLTRKMAAGIVGGILFSAGIVALVIQGILALIPSISRLGDFTLYACMKSLATGLDVAGAAGGLGTVHIMLTVLCFVVVFSAASLVALKKKDI